MLWTLVLILFALWALGVLTGYALGGAIHVLFVVALVALVFRLVTGRRVV